MKWLRGELGEHQGGENSRLVSERRVGAVGPGPGLHTQGDQKNP